MPFEGGKLTEQWIGTWLEKALANGTVKRDKLLAFGVRADFIWAFRRAFVGMCRT